LFDLKRAKSYSFTGYSHMEISIKVKSLAPLIIINEIFSKELTKKVFSYIIFIINMKGKI